MHGRRVSILLIAIFTFVHSTPLILRGRWAVTLDDDSLERPRGQRHGGVLVAPRDGERRRLQSAPGRQDHRRSVSDTFRRITSLDEELTEHLLAALADQVKIDDVDQLLLEHGEDRHRMMPGYSNVDDDSGPELLRIVGPSSEPSAGERMEKYRAEVEKVKDAIAGSEWYSEDYSDNEETPRTGIFNPFHRRPHAESLVMSRSRVRRAANEIHSRQKSEGGECDGLRHLVNDSCNSVFNTDSLSLARCRSFLMCALCKSREDDDNECALRHGMKSCTQTPPTSGDDVTKMACREKLVLSQLRQRVPDDVGSACAKQCARFRLPKLGARRIIT